MVPREYSNECIVARPTPYHVIAELAKGSQPRKGTLDIGRVVWTTKPLAEACADDKISAYANGVGPIEIDPKDLNPF